MGEETRSVVSAVSVRATSFWFTRWLYGLATNPMFILALVFTGPPGWLLIGLAFVIPDRRTNQLVRVARARRDSGDLPTAAEYAKAALRIAPDHKVATELLLTCAPPTDSDIADAATEALRRQLSRFGRPDLSLPIRRIQSRKPPREGMLGTMAEQVLAGSRASMILSVLTELDRRFGVCVRDDLAQATGKKVPSNEELIAVLQQRSGKTSADWAVPDFIGLYRPAIEARRGQLTVSAREHG